MSFLHILELVRTISFRLIDLMKYDSKCGSLKFVTHKQSNGGYSKTLDYY